MKNAFGRAVDLTHRQAGCPSGTAMLRMCFGCNKRRAELGGHVNKRTRMWYCAACKPKEKT